MRRTCRSSTAGCRSWPLRRPRSSSSSSGMLLHRKNDSRDASSRSLTDTACRARRRRVALGAEHELRAGEDGAERALDAALEAAVLAAGVVERQQAGDLRRRRPAGDTRGAPACATICWRAGALPAPPSRRAAASGSGGGSACRPARVALNGPVTVTLSMCGSPVWSVVSTLLRRNGCSRFAALRGGPSAGTPRRPRAGRP